jgi:hypothetical protein
MDISITDTLPSRPTVSAPATDPAHSPGDDATDSIRLSEEAQVRLRVQQGESPAEIALDLGVAAMTVTTYLVQAPPPEPAIPKPQDGPSPTASIPAMG